LALETWTQVTQPHKGWVGCKVHLFLVGAHTLRLVFFTFSLLDRLLMQGLMRILLL
jgi:hypothetical protein